MSLTPEGRGKEQSFVMLVMEDPGPWTYTRDTLLSRIPLRQGWNLGALPPSKLVSDE